MKSSKQQRKGRQFQKRLLRLESLEDRRLMAANVTFNQGLLSIEGTSANDHIVIGQRVVELSPQYRYAISMPVTTVTHGHVDLNGNLVQDGQRNLFGRINQVNFYGYSGHDFFRNNTSIATVAYGGLGSDIIYGGSSGDRLYGSDFQAGADSGYPGLLNYQAHDGHDQLFGNAGDDYLYGGTGNDFLSGASGNDWLAGATGNDRIFAGDGNDVVLGHRGNDVILGGAGNDRIYGGEGDDMISAYQGNDLVYGGQGNDNIRGGDGRDYLFGAAGNDRILGEGGIDVLRGGAGNDTLLGGGSNDSLFGDMGNDRLLGSAGEDRLYGGHGQDVLKGGAGNDRLVGEEGDDVLHGDAGNDVLRGDDGKDILNGNTGADVLHGGNGDDVLHGNAGNDQIFGQAGKDHLYSGSGADRMHGGSGDDTLISIDGDTNDFLFGNAGKDSFWVDEDWGWFFSDYDAIQDATHAENATNVHQVARFSNGADKTLDGDNIVDPTDGRNYKNFANNPLFASTGPGSQDINQGDIGDCWLMAALGAAANANPNSIHQSVVSLGDGTFAVEMGGSYYRVDADLPTETATSNTLTFAGLGRENSIWVPILEKAYAIHRTGANTYQSLDGGFSASVFSEMGMRNADRATIRSPRGALQYIHGQLRQGKAVVVNIVENPPAGIPLVGPHAYMVERVNFGTVDFGDGLIGRVPVSITLRNPWGFDGGGNQDLNPNDGLVTVTGVQLVRSLWGDNNGIQSANLI